MSALMGVLMCLDRFVDVCVDVCVDACVGIIVENCGDLADLVVVAVIGADRRHNAPGSTGRVGAEGDPPG